MPRRPRIHLPGVPIHLVQRGHNRDACFFAEEDFQVYRKWLAKKVCQLHAYVIMANHVHLLLSPPSYDSVVQFELFLPLAIAQKSYQTNF